ncbi:MAG: hypothetical protein AAFN11_15060 [Chloroflexota bacterium]
MRILITRLILLWLSCLVLMILSLAWASASKGDTLIYGNVQRDEQLILYETNRPHATVISYVSELRLSVNDSFFTYTHTRTGRIHMLSTDAQRTYANQMPNSIMPAHVYSISPDDTYILYSDDAGTLYSYDTQDGTSQAIEVPFYANVYRDTFVWLPDNTQFLMLGVDTESNASYYILDADTGDYPPFYRNLAMLHPSRTLLVLPFPNSNALLNYNSFQVFITPDSEPVQRDQRMSILSRDDYGSIRDIAISPNGDTVATVLTPTEDAEHYVLQVYDVETGEWDVILEIGTPIEGLYPPYFVRWSPDGERLMTNIVSTDGTQCPYRTVTLLPDGSDMQDMFTDCDVRRMPYYLPR